MTEGGRAQRYLVPAVAVAFVLMLVAIGVTVLTSTSPTADARPSATPSPIATSTAAVSAAVPSSPGTSATPSPRPLVLPAPIVDRPALPFCGHETVDRQPEGDRHDAGIHACFLDAYEAGRTAEMITDGLTAEGGPVRDILRLLESGELEWYIDLSQDPAGTSQWTRAVCRTLNDHGPDPAGVPILLPDDCVIADLATEIEPTGDEVRMLERLVAFARDPEAGTLQGIPMSADGVRLGLGTDLIVRRTSDELRDPAAWIMDVESFRERAGPFSAITVLTDWNPADAFEVREAAVQVGDHPFCASAALPRPDELVGLRRLSIQPVFIGPAPCLTYWTVDLYLASDGSIEAITIDFGTP